MENPTKNQDTPVRAVNVGDAVTVTDEHGTQHAGLVTAVHGTFNSSFVPAINAVYVSSDATKSDPYGRQTERLSSLAHRSTTTAHGRYWE